MTLKESETSKRIQAEARPVAETGKKRIYVVDDHVILRQGLTILINGTPDLIMCGESSSAEEALQGIPQVKADLAIVDLSLDGTSGLELIKSLRARHPELLVLVLSMHEESFFA